VAIVVVDDVPGAAVTVVVVVVVSSALPPHAAATSVKTPSSNPSHTFFISLLTLHEEMDSCAAEPSAGTVGFRSPNTRIYTMAIVETRIDRVEFACRGCDCGTCVTDSIREIQRIYGVDSVRVDRGRSQIVVRHDPVGVSRDRLRSVVTAKGIRLTG